MQTYRVSKAGRIRAVVLLITIATIALYAAQKAWGLWRSPARSSDLALVGLDVNTLVPAGLLTMVALAAIPVGWYIVVELLTVVRLDENGMLFQAPSFRVFYRWDEIESLDVITGPVEDAATALQVETQPALLAPEIVSNGQNVVEPAVIDPVETYLSAADLRENKVARRRNRAASKVQLATIRGRAIGNDGAPLKRWVRWLYPQARRPDRLLLYPALENRTALLAQVEAFLQLA